VTADNKAADSDLAEDFKPYHILSYANGPGESYPSSKGTKYFKSCYQW